MRAALSMVTVVYLATQGECLGFTKITWKGKPTFLQFQVGMSDLNIKTLNI